MKVRWPEGLCISLLMGAMLLPIWIGDYAPLYDYSNHLLEAQIVTHYTDPQWGYAESYELNPGWYLRSNALSTLLLVGLGQVMPILVAGQIILSLYLILFVGGLVLFLSQAGNRWPLLLLAPTLAYNFTFTSGWLNFCYGVALGLYALVIYRRWQEQRRWPYLVGLACLMLLIYMAHLMAWAFWLVIFATMLAVEPYQWQRHGWLLLALNSALPLLLLTRPTLAVAALLSAPLIWSGGVLWRRLRLSPRLLAFVAAGIASLGVGVVKVGQPFYQPFLPGLDYGEFDKVTFPVRLFTLPHQFMPPDPILIAYNLVLLILILTLTGLLIVSNWGRPDPQRQPWLAVLGLLFFFYIIIPSRTLDIWITEPRILLLATFTGLALVRLPAVGQPLRRAIIICLVSLCFWSLGGTIHYAWAYDQQAQAWKAQMAMLAPARRVLLLREKTSVYIGRPTLLGSFNRFYTGEFFSTVYTLEHGGFASRTFNNGPVRPRPAIPIPSYDWPGFRDTDYVAEHCSNLQKSYDAVLFWGQPGETVAAQLNDCFVAGPHWPDLAIWHNSVKPKASVAN